MCNDIVVYFITDGMKHNEKGSKFVMQNYIQRMIEMLQEHSSSQSHLCSKRSIELFLIIKRMKSGVQGA